MGANIAYVRVSTVEQNEERQIEALKKYNIDNECWFIEKVSAKDTNRPKLQEMLRYARKGDTIYVHDLSRLARSIVDLNNIINELNKKEVHLVSNKDSIDTSTATGRLMINLIGVIYQFERENSLERQREGIAVAKREGKYKGRKEVVIKDFDKQYQRYLDREISKPKLAEELKISRSTLDKLIKQLNSEKGLQVSNNECK